MHSQRDSLGCSPVSWVVRAALPWPRVASRQERGKGSEGTHGDARCWRGCGSQQVSRHSTRARLRTCRHPTPTPHDPLRGLSAGPCWTSKEAGGLLAGRVLTMCLSPFSTAHHLKPLRGPRRRLSHILLSRYHYLQSTKGKHIHWPSSK